MRKTVALLLIAALCFCGAAAAGAADYAEADLTGEWLQEETQWESLFAARNPDGGWDIEILSPVTHAAAVFLGRFVFDGGEEAFICRDGRLYEAPITDDETESGLGKLISEKLHARIVPEAGENGDELRLAAYTGMHDFSPVVFVRAEATAEAPDEEQPEP